MLYCSYCGTTHLEIIGLDSSLSSGFRHRCLCVRIFIGEGGVPAGMSTGREIHLTEDPDGWWTARDCEEELTAQGETRKEALANLDRVVAIAKGKRGQEPTNVEIQNLGLDPGTIGSEDGLLPDSYQK